MAGNRQEFTYAINADTSKAKKQIADLFKSLDNVQKYSLDNFNIAPDLVKASHAAEELAGHLRMATNVNTGQLDLAKFNQSIRNSNTSLTELISNLGQGGSAGQAAFEQMTAAIARTQVPLRQTSALLKDMATTLKNTVKWELSSAAVHGLESALSGAVSYAKNLNTSLTNIRIVTGQSVEDMARFTKEANAAAKALSTTTKSYADASLIYYQQGDSQEMAAKKAAITIKAANASFETSAKEMSEYLTSVWNSYQVGADELERYVDIMANLGAKTATSLEEIATSMQKVAATSNTVGVSMEQVSSIIATVSSVTRESAESIGTSYKTIFARIGDLKLGKADEDGIGLGQVSSQLDAIGVKILDESGNLREMGDIIMDLGTKWQTMNQAQKTAVAQVVAGKRQYTQLMALFENWDMFQANLNLAENSEGALQDMADIYAESWEAASARVQASMEGIFNSIINDQGLIKLTNFTADFVDGIGSAIDSIGGLNGVLRLTSSILMKTFSKEAGARIKDLGRSVVGMFQDPKKNYQQASQQIREQLANINNKKQVDAQIQLIDAKNQLLQVEEYLSATQKQVAQAGIADIENQVNKVKELEDAYTDLQNDIANVNLNRLGAAQSSNSYMGTLAQTFKDFYAKDISDDLFETVNLKADKSLQGVYNALSRSSQMAGMGNQGLAAISPENLAQYDNLEQRMSVVRQEAEGLRSMMEELGITIQGMPIERLNQMLEKTDWNDEDIQALRNALEQLERTGVENCANLERVINKFLEEASQAGFAAEDIERLRQAFERVSAAGDDLANAQRKVAAASESLSQKTDKLNHSLDRQSMSFEKAVESALDLGSGALDLINGFSAMSDVTAQWGDESLSLADKLGSLLSTVLSLGMAIPSLAKGLTALGVAAGPAGWIALAAAAGMGALGVVAGNYEADKKEYQDKQNKTDKKRQEEVQKTDEELSNIQTLMKNYNTLRETYISTGEGQDALAASARALAEAYGLVGANLLIAEGNFSAFEQMIASSTGLDKVSNFYEAQLRAGREELADVGNVKSKYYDQSYLDFASDYDVGQYNYTRPEISNKQLEAMVASDANLIEDYYLDTIEAARQALIDGGEKTAEYNIFANRVSQASKGQIPIGGFNSGFDLGLFEDVWGLDQTITLPENYQDILMDNLYEYFDADIFELFQGNYGNNNEAPSDILDQFEQLLKVDEDGNYTILESDLANIHQQAQDLKIRWLKDFASWGEKELALMAETFTVDEKLLTKNYNDAIAERERAQEAAIQGQRDADTAAAIEAYNTVATEINYFDVLTNEDGYLSYNDEGTDKFEWLKTFEKQKKAAQEEYDKIEAELKSDNVKKGSYLETLLTNRLGTLKMMLNDFEQMSDADLSTLIEQMTGYETAAEKVRMITEVMSKMIGKSEANTSFTDFNSYMNNIQAGIDASAKEYEQLQTYLQTDENGKFLLGQDGTYLIKEGFKEKYQVARDAIAAGYISDFTAFDDYLTIYQSIAAIFSGDDFTEAMSYIDAQEIKNSREVNSRLLNAMQRDIQNGEVGATAGDVLAYNRQTLAGEKVITDYETLSSLASSYKEDLNLTDAQGLLSILQQKLDDGTNAWNDFIQMDFDQRQAYLQAREESALKAAQEAQRQIAAEAVEQQKALYTSEDVYQKSKTDLQKFLDTHTKQADGTYINNQTNKEVESGVAQYWDNVSTKIADYEQYGLDIENALAIADAIELILTQTAGLSEQMQTLVADFEQFNKTGRVSADVMKKMAEWGIDGSKIKTAQDYLKIMKSIYTQAKTNASTAEQNYLAMVGENKYDWSDEQVQKDHAEEYTAWQEMMRLKQIEYDTEEQYNTTRQGYLDSELAKHQQILSQMRERKSLAEEEANKTQQLAEAMSAAIQSGNLSESARIGMDPELLNAWDNAADATERGAIAAQAWNKYATQISTAGEELNILYNNASNALNAFINNRGRYGSVDLSNFNFADSVKGQSDFAAFISQQIKDPAAQAIWNEGFESLISHTNISNMSDLEILTAVKDEIIKAGDINEEEFNRILAGVRDNITSTFEQLAQQNIDAAQKAADAWLQAFNTIKNARETLLSGGDILDQIAGDPEAFMDLMQSTGLSADALYDMILSNDREGLLAATRDYIKSDKYVSELLKGQGFVTDKFGSIGKAADVRLLGYKRQQDGTWQDQFGNKVEYDKEIKADVTSHWAKLLENSLELTPEDSKKLAQQIWEDPLLYRENLKEPAADLAEAIRRSTDLMTVQADRQEKLAAIEYAADTQNLKYDENGNIIVGDSTFGAMINGQTGTYEEYEKLASAIANAQEAKAAGESWETLSQADQDLLAKYNINFDNVDESANSCATALAACAEAAYQLAMVAAGDGYKYDEGLGYHVNEYGQQDDQSRVLDQTYQSKESAWDNVSDVNRKTTELYAESADFSYEELENYTETLVENGKIIETNKEKQMELAAGIAKQEKAISDAKKSFKDWNKILNDSNSTSEEITRTVEDMREAYEDMFHLTEDESNMLSDTFLKSAENAELLERVLEDDAEAWDELQAKVAEEIIIQSPDLDQQMKTELIELTDIIANYDFGDMEVGTAVDLNGFKAGAAEMIYESRAAAEAASAALSAVGVDADIVEHTETAPPVTRTKTVTGTISVPTIDGTTVEMTASGTVTEETDAADFTWYTLEGAEYNGGGVSHPSGGGGGSSGGKGGGGGGEKKKEKKKKLRARDEIERYHTNEKVLESIESVLTEIDKLKDRAYGADHIKQLDAETEALKKQLKAQQALKAEAESYIPQDRGEFLSYGAQFDADGVIINYESVMQSIMDEYNQAIEDYNNSEQEDSDKERLEEAKQKYDDLKDSIEKYEEAIQKAQDAANEMLEIENQMSELELEKVTYKLELEIEVNDTELEIIDYYKTKYEESLKDQDEYFGKLIEANAVYEDNLIHLRTAEEELNAKYRAGLINDADYAEGLADIQSQMIDNLKNIEELKKDISEVYENTLEMAREQIEEITDLIDGSISSIESYISILELSGREKDYDTLKDLYEALYQNNFALIDINKAHLDSLKAEEEALLRKYNGDSEAMSEADKERHMVLRKQIQETQDALNEATEATLDTLRSGFEVIIQSIGDELDHFMAGASTSLAHLQEQYDYYTETQGRYVSAAKELYEVSKLNRDIENSLTTATSSAAKEALKALQEKINKQSELNELTEYDIEMNQLQYQLLLARIKLEESQNAKDTVRLTRDEDGNYAYRYTANQEKIDEAAQHYEDVLQQINDLTVERTNEIESQILSTMQNYKEKLMEISLDYSLTEEERLLKLEELNAQYAETMQYLQEQNNIVTQNLTDNQSAIAEHYGANISNITASTAGNVNSSVQSMIDKANEYIAAMSNAIYGDGGILSNWQGYEEKIDEVNKASGTSYESLREEAKATTEMLEGFENQAIEIISTLENTLIPLSELTQAWDDHGVELDTITSKYESLVEAIQATRNAMDNFGDSSSLITDVNKMPGQQSNYAGLTWFDGSQFNPMGMGFGMGMGMNNPMMAWPSLDQNTINYLMTNTKVTTESMMSALSNLYHAPSVMYDRSNENEVLTQDVRITAEFPSVTDRNEIEEALLGLANRASQFASRQKK